MVVDESRTDRAPTRHKEHTRGSGDYRALLVLAGVAAGYAFTVFVFYPGYVTVDARYVYADALAWQFGDWQSPAMGVLWRLIDPIAPGSLGMFLLTVTLYWLGFGLIAITAARHAARHAAWLAPATLLLALIPPAFFFVGLIWRDILFGVIWLVAAALAFVAVDRNVVMRLPLQALSLALTAFGVLLRPNAILAAPFLAAYAVWPRRFDVKRMAIVFLPAAMLAYALVPLVYYGVLDAKRQNPLHSIMVFDLGGITHVTGVNQFRVAWTTEQTALLTSRCYDPVRWDSYWHVPPCPFVMQRLERPDDLIFGTSRLFQAWWRAVTAHPIAYLTHRATFMWQFLARSNLVLPVWDWPDPVSGYGNSPPMRAIVALHEALAPSVLFRPGSWLILAGAVFALAWRLRSGPEGAFAVAVTASAIVYVMTFLVVGVASDFRYAYWCVLATLVAAVAAAAGHRRRSKQTASK